MSSSPTALTVSLCANPVKNKVLITLTPPYSPEYTDDRVATDVPHRRSPLDICCVIDVSGSMSTRVSIPGNPEQGTSPQKTSLTVLDVVKHSLQTIVSTMQENDRMALVTFSSVASTRCDFTFVDSAHKNELMTMIDSFFPSGSTNLWDGLRSGMDLAFAGQSQKASSPFNPTAKKDRNMTIFLLTDGMPNVIPEVGHTAALKAYLATRCPSAALPFSIHTFGYGSSIDTPLLSEISTIGGGDYTFIKDVAAVGITFINAVGSAYAIYAQHIKVDCQLLAHTDGTDVLRNFEVIVKGQIPSTKTASGIQFDATDIQYGQPKHFILDISPSLPPLVRTIATYHLISSSSYKRTNTAEWSSSQEPTDKERADIEYYDATFTLASILLNSKAANRVTSAAAIGALQNRLTQEPGLAEHPYSAALAEDMCVNMLPHYATHDNWMGSGQHYMPGRASAMTNGTNYEASAWGYMANTQSAVNIEEQNKLRRAWFDANAPMPLPSLPSLAVGQPSQSESVLAPLRVPEQNARILSPVPEVSDTTSTISSLPTTPEVSSIQLSQTPRAGSPEGQGLSFDSSQSSQLSSGNSLLRLKNFLKGMREERTSSSPSSPTSLLPSNWKKPADGS